MSTSFTKHLKGLTNMLKQISPKITQARSESHTDPWMAFNREPEWEIVSSVSSYGLRKSFRTKKPEYTTTKVCDRCSIQ